MSLENITSNYLKTINDLPQNVQLVAVSKTHPIEEIQHVYNLGQRIFGENKVQELTEKHPQLPKDIQAVRRIKYYGVRPKWLFHLLQLRSFASIRNLWI